MERNTVKLQGFNVDTFTFDEALNFIEKGQVVTINPEMIQTASKNPEFAGIINNAELVIPDGIGVEIGLKILRHNVHRIAGIEFGRKLIDKFAGQPTAFIGAKPEIIVKAVENLKKATSKTMKKFYQNYKNQTRNLPSSHLVHLNRKYLYPMLKNFYRKPFL